MAVSTPNISETHIGGGRSRLRRALYRAALPAALRCNVPLMALYQRLRGRGKPHASALVACARKLLIYANAAVARGTPWATAPLRAALCSLVRLAGLFLRPDLRLPGRGAQGRSGIAAGHREAARQGSPSRLRAGAPQRP